MTDINWNTCAMESPDNLNFPDMVKIARINFRSWRTIVVGYLSWKSEILSCA